MSRQEPDRGAVGAAPALDVDAARPAAGDAGLAARTVRGTLWNLLTFAVSKGSLLLTTVVLARMLPPADFGLLALGLLVITYLDVLGDAGVGSAVIYREERSRGDASTAVLVAAGVAFVLAALTFLGAGGLAAVFDEPRLTDVVRVLAVAFFINMLAVVHRRTLERDLLFRRRMVAEVAAAVVKGGSAIALALAGAGVWALVWGQLLGWATSTVLLWVVSTWRFTWRFDARVARELLRYGLPVTLLGLLAAAVRTTDVLVIGQRLDAEALGHYTIAFRLPELLLLQLCFLASQALFPAYTRARGDAERLRAGFRSTLRLMALVTTPVGLGLAVVAPDAVPLLFGGQWGPAVPVTQVLALYGVAYALAFNVGDVYKATGRPGVLNVFAVVRLALLVPSLWLLAPRGLVHVAVVLLVVELAMAVLQLVVASRLMQVALPAVLGEFVPAALSGAALLAASLGARALLPADAGVGLRLPVVVLAGAVAYVGVLCAVSRDTVRRVAALVTGSGAQARQARR